MLSLSPWKPKCLTPILGHLRRMFIQVQETPNPNSLKFLPGNGKTILESAKTLNYTSLRSAKNSPLAKRLFQVEGVSNVFLAQEFLTITKEDDSEWNVMKPQIFATVMDHFNSGLPSVVEKEGDEPVKQDSIDDPVVEMILELLDTRIRPTVQEDGGDIEFEGWNKETGVVTLRLQGACTGCPSSIVTLKSGIESMLKFYIPEVKSVEQVSPEADRPTIVDAAGNERRHPVDEEFDKLQDKIRVRQTKTEQF